MRKIDRTRAGIAGVIAAALAIAVPELLAGVFDSFPSPILAVGGVTIDWAPPFLKDFAISVFGTADKAALSIGIAVIVLVIGWFTGVAARRSWWIATAVFTAFGVLGVLAGSREQEATWTTAAAAGAVAVAAGLGFLWVTLRAATPPADPSELAAGDSSRRRFLTLAAAGAGVAAASGVTGRVLISRVPPPPVTGFANLDDPLPALAPGQSFAVPGVAPVEVPNADFYRIDTALLVPRVDTVDWRLTIHGLVEREVSFSYDDLLGRDLIERWVTLSCVSNQVGGSLVGNARWIGVPLAELLDEAGVLPEATQIVGRSVDDFTVGFPTEVAFDGRDAMVAIGMNGETLPRRHGYPARLVVPGLYGYVSATKWLSDIELTTWDGFDAYWVPRGWAKEAPIKTQSRIDVPRHGSTVTAGAVTCAGVAWAPGRGISAVEVRVDGGPWVAAEIADPVSPDAWVQWRADVDLAAGRRLIEVRATDGDGVPQTEEVHGARPDGATGYHRVEVTAA